MNIHVMCKNKIAKTILLICILFIIQIALLYSAECGDVNMDTYIDIADALLIARYFVELPVAVFEPDLADVDGNSVIDIADALLVAQYYVGYITEFPNPCPAAPGPSETPGPTSPDDTPSPLYPDNLDDLTNFIPLDATEQDRLLENGFLVLDSIRMETLTQSYLLLSEQNTVPAFITTDALLHVFHLTYAHMLEITEKYLLFNSLTDILTGFEADVSLEYENITASPFLKEACRRLRIFFAVATALINGETSITGNDDIAAEVNDYLDKIDTLTVEPSPGEDYTHYTPRGHYAVDEDLMQYFRAMTWCKRKQWKLDAEYDIAASAIMASLLVKNATVKSLYEEVDTLLTKLKNAATGITPFGICQAMQSCFGDDYLSDGYFLLEVPENRVLLREELLTGNYGEDPFVQFLGERRAMDLEIFKQTTHPVVADREVPSGLDIASILFNSTAAYEELQPEMTGFTGLRTSIDTQTLQFSSMPETEWIGSASDYWLYTLRSFSLDLTGSVPFFMQSGTWAREKINTQLASWTELQSDSIYFSSTPEPTPGPTDPPGTGDVWFVPQNITTDTNSYFDVELHFNSGSQVLAMYEIDITFDETYITVNTDRGMSGVNAGSDGFISAVNTSDPGRLSIIGFDASGTGPGPDLHVVTISWITGPIPGDTAMDITIFNLVDSNSSAIGDPNGIAGSVTLTRLIAGDVNNDSTVDIIDALLITQYYVGLNPSGFNSAVADVNCSGTIDIVDSLLIAQFYIGLINELNPCAQPTPEGTPVPTLTPTPEPPVCFVEPYPYFYERLKGMCNQVINTLNNAGISIIHIDKFQTIHDWANTYGVYAQRQLDGIPLILDEYNNIYNFWIDLGVFFSTASFVPEAGSKAQIITDIYTYEDKVLHEAVGKIHPMIVLYPLSGQTGTRAAVGYVLSHYEFLEKDNNRLTNEKWVDMLNYAPPPRPSYTDTFVDY